MFLCLIGFLHDIVLDIAVGSFISSSSMDCSEIALSVIRVSPDFVVLLGLQQSLTPSRSNAFLNMLRLMQKKALQLAVEAEKGENSGLKMDGSVENVNFGSNSDLGVEETPVGVSNSGLKVDSRDGNVNVELDS